MAVLRSRMSLAALLGGALLALVAAAVYALLSRGDSGDEPPSFHFIATLDVEQAGERGDPPVDEIEAWYEPGKGARWQLRYDDSARAWMGSDIFLSRGGQTIYDGKTNTYIQHPAPETIEAYPASIPAFSIQLGPLPAPDLESFFDRRQAAWQIVGEEELLGRRVKVVRLAGRGGGESTYWIEPEHMFALRFESRGAGQVITARIDQLEFGIDIDDKVLSFVPPARSRELQPSNESMHGSSGPIGLSTFTVPEGFLAPTYIPEGYVTKGAGSTQGNGVTTAHRVSLGAGREGSPTLFIEQQFRAGGLPGPVPQAAIVRVNGSEAYRATRGDEETLVWAVDDVIVTVRTTSLPFAELLRIAESMN
jgi:hypothetical protein